MKIVTIKYRLPRKRKKRLKEKYGNSVCKPLSFYCHDNTTKDQIIDYAGQITLISNEKIKL